MTAWYDRKTIVWPVALLLVCLLAYLPVCSFLFSLKNDAFLYNFPNKAFFSEVLHAGELPAWNPYLNYGFPLYADPGFAWWQPLTWIFGAIGYNAYTFTVEVLLYIYIAGLGMYWLGNKLQLHPATAFAIACMFMCCGFFVGNLQHINFITCAAFLPWLTGAWLLYQQYPSTKNLSRCGVAAYLVCTGGHPAIPIATLYFMALLTIAFYYFKRKETFLRPFLLRQLRLVLFAAVLLLPLIISYYRLLPLYARAEPTVQATSLQVGFTLPSFISFLFPFATIKNETWFGTDVSMRNAYFSVAGLVFFVRFLFQKKQNAIQRIFLIAAVVLVFFSAGGAIKKALYQTFPLLQFIRTNGEFRVFTIFSCLICSSYELDAWVTQRTVASIRIQKFFKTLCVAAAAIAIASFFMSGWNQLFSGPDASVPARLKAIIDHISFGQTLFIAAAFAFFLCLLYLYGLQKKGMLYFLAVLLFDVIVNCWLLLPITGVSRTPVANVQAILNRSPHGFPAPSLQYQQVEKPVTAAEETLIGNWDWYGKRIVYAGRIDYPSALKTTASFFAVGDTAAIKNKPALFLKTGSGRIAWNHFSPAKMDVAIAASAPDTLILLQNYFPGWRIWVNEKVSPVHLYQNTFMLVPVDDKTKTVSFRFSPFSF